MNFVTNHRRDRLDVLADRYGISTSFRDAHGNQVTARPETLKLLLTKMGVELDPKPTDAAAASFAEPDTAVLPPVEVVVRCPDGDCCIELNLPADVEEIDWIVRLEDGSERRGTAPVTRSPSGLLRLTLPQLPFGYHQLQLPNSGTTAELVVSPGQCWVPSAFDNGPGLWGISAQLYLVRSAQNWGIGDFADLKELVTTFAERGCDVVGLNPLHQMMLDDPESASPYSPLTRLYLNVLYIAVPNVIGADAQALRDVVNSSRFQTRLAACRAAPLVDYSEVLALKLEALRVLHAAFPAAATPDRERFEAFCSQHGNSLRRTAIFQALRHHFAAQPSSFADWQSWPQDYQAPTSPSVARFAQQHADDIDFYIWLQWVADEQLAQAAQAASDAGMAVGLYRDLAVGCDSSGAETWANPEAFIAGTRVGAPPDIFNPAGQNWGLPPFHPHALRNEAYRSFIELVRANMRHAGAIRIDHVMGLQQLYCIPDGCNAAEGAYIKYRLDDLIGILALESHRARCLVVGEDLGTVPEGFQDKMAHARILSYRVMVFEQDWDSGEFLSPEVYPRLALAVTGNHDLPTLVGWWAGNDIILKDKLGLFPADTAAVQYQRRDQERAAIIRAFNSQGLAISSTTSGDDFAAAAHEFLAGSGSALLMAQLDDLLAGADQVNVPATFLEHPNWRRKYNATLEEIACSDRVWQLARPLWTARPKPASESPVGRAPAG